MIPIRREWSAMKRLALLSPALATPAVEDTATGNPLTFVTDLAKPLKSLLIPFSPRQSGTGDPSPQNIRSIVPWNGLTVFGGGKNLLDPSHRSAQGNNAQYYRSGNRFLLKGGQTYTLSANVIPAQINIFKGTNTAIATTNSATLTYAPTENVEVWFDFYIPNSRLPEGGISAVYGMLEAGQTATAYEPYKPITETDIVFPSPVYGGEHEAVSGKMMDGWSIVDVASLPRDNWKKSSSYSGSFYYNWQYILDGLPYATEFVCSHAKFINGFSNYAYGMCATDTSMNLFIMSAGSELTDLYDYLDGQKTSGTPVMVCVKLATPQEIQLTPAQITALVGDNTIWSDADGSMTAIYLKKK